MTPVNDSTCMTDHLRLTALAPVWFRTAIKQPVTSHYVEVDGCPIHYLRWHHDPPPTTPRGLLFVHGGGAHAHWWRFIAPFFSRDFRVVALDLSGMGDSGARTAYGAEQRVSEIRAVLADAELGSQPLVVAHSYGGHMFRGHLRGGDRWCCGR